MVPWSRLRCVWLIVWDLRRAHDTPSVTCGCREQAVNRAAGVAAPCVMVCVVCAHAHTHEYARVCVCVVCVI